MPTKEEYIAWAAGLYEGEGYTDRKHPIQIGQKDTWILYKLKEIFGGNVSGDAPPKWNLCGEQGRILLKLFVPYLSPWRTKQIIDKDVLTVIKKKNTCMHGHEFTPTNTRWNATNGKRQCRICEDVAYRKRKGLYVA